MKLDTIEIYCWVSQSLSTSAVKVSDGYIKNECLCVGYLYKSSRVQWFAPNFEYMHIRYCTGTDRTVISVRVFGYCGPDISKIQIFTLLSHLWLTEPWEAVKGPLRSCQGTLENLPFATVRRIATLTCSKCYFRTFQFSRNTRVTSILLELFPMLR